MSGPQRTLPRWGVTQRVILCSLFVSLPLLPQFPLPSWALEQAQTPAQVVQQWLTVYPKDLDTAVTLTTANLRDGWSQKEWVRTKKPLLAVTQLKFLGGEILSEEITGIHAIVMVNAHIWTSMGEQLQRERYRLLRVKGQWLIDSVKVTAEKVLGEVR